MPEPPSSAPPSLQAKQIAAAKAATLAERADALARRLGSDTGRPPGPDSAAVVQSWNQAFSRGDEEAFRHRLAWEGLDLEGARRVAAGIDLVPIERLPAWTTWLDRIHHHAQAVGHGLRRGALAEIDAVSQTDEPPFAELWVAPLRAAREELGGRVPASAFSRVTPGALGALDRQLMREVSQWAARATLEHFRDALQLTSQSSDEAGARAIPPDVYREFVLAMLDRGLGPLWTAYPVLARQVATVVEGWVESTAELLERLDRDWTTIATRFAADANPGRVRSIDPALSDPHHGRRRVVALGFEFGLRLVYKPRDLALDRAFNDLLTWAAVRGLPSPPPPLSVLTRDGYGWVEYALHEGLETREHARQYYRQSGSLLCLSHVLRGRDLHMENLVATRGGPVLIDVEPLLQPVRASRGPALDASGSLADPHRAQESCLATGLLSMFEIGPDGEAFDVGGLRGDGNGVLSVAPLAWRGLRSADLHCVEETAFAAKVSNRVHVQGIMQRPEDYADDVLAGFTETYRWLLTNRDDLLGSKGPVASFAGCRTRIISRSTNQYATLGAVLATPGYQRDGARASAAMDILLRPFSGSRRRPALWPALVAERQALEALDVPYFWVFSDRIEVCAGDRQIAADYFVTSGLAALRDSIGQLSEADLGHQSSVLRRALEESPRSRFASVAAASVASSPQANSTHGLFVDTAIWIAHEVQLRVGLGAHHAADWPSGPVDRPPNSCPHVLYDGTVGVAVFFAALHQVTGDPQWAESSRAALAPLWTSVVRGDLATWSATGIGAGDGLGSLVYGLTWIGRWLHDPRCLETAFDVATVLAGQIDQDTHDDVLSGAAGGILALLALDRVRPDARLVAGAAACGARLVARQIPSDDGSAWANADGRRLVGFAHGAAGIAYALACLFQATGMAEVGEAAARGFRFERRQYLAREGNWRVEDGDADGDALTAPAMTAWCHGAPGVLLANVLAGSTGDASDSDAGLDAALATTARWLPGRGDHLCCGTSGRSDVLLTVGQRLGRPEVIAAAMDLGERMTARARAAGHFRLGGSAFEYRVFDPGFFRGLAGIGYTLLRLAAPSRLPSILAFEGPPRDRAREAGAD